MAKKKNKQKTQNSLNPGDRPITENRKSRHKYDVLDTLECGLALFGSEVKSLRSGKISLDESYGRVINNEVWLVGCDIPEYAFSNRMNHDPKRRRKVLLHRREIRKFAGQAFEKGLTLVPLKLYFKKGRAKLLLGICRGRKLYDKREKMKKETVRRDIERALRRR